ncbi:unnamed protein product, partial [Bubo scandiacus]
KLDLLKMVMQRRSGQIQSPEQIQARDMLLWTGVPGAGHHSPPLLPICVMKKTAGVQLCSYT